MRNWITGAVSAAAGLFTPLAFAQSSGWDPVPDTPTVISMVYPLPSQCLEAMPSPVPWPYPLQVQQRDCRSVGWPRDSSYSPQSWRFIRQPDGKYTIVNTGTGKCLDVEGHSTAAGTRVLEWGCHGMSNQRWIVEGLQFGSSYLAVIRAADSGHCLGLGAGGARAVACNFESNQQPVWTLRDPRDRETPGVQVSVVHGGLCVREVGTWVDLGPCNATNRLTVLPTFPNYDRFSLKMPSGRCLAFETGRLTWAAGRDCRSWEPAQQWQAVRNGAAWQLRNVATGQCLNAEGWGTVAGTWLIHWPCAPASDNARWTTPSH